MSLFVLVIYILVWILVIVRHFYEKNDSDEENASSNNIYGKMTISSKGCAEIPREFFNIESGGASCSSVSQPWVNGGSWSCMSETCDDDDDDDDDLPPRIDWREMGAVNDVMNQLDCDSCWAFSAVTSVEGILKIKTDDRSSIVPAATSFRVQFVCLEGK
ncbi:hypothetical protein P8452_61953 [Trifolium repens]|nr:hypothetical protein P8452_61953 [Trifolium repens]